MPLYRRIFQDFALYIFLQTSSDIFRSSELCVCAVFIPFVAPCMVAGARDESDALVFF